jgi:hypothetical protein
VPDAPVTIVVENQNFYDATIYLRWYNGERRRLGTVTGYTTREFDTRWVAPEVQVEVDLLAGGTYRGDRISVSPGESRGRADSARPGQLPGEAGRGDRRHVKSGERLG